MDIACFCVSSGAVSIPAQVFIAVAVPHNPSMETTAAITETALEERFILDIGRLLRIHTYNTTTPADAGLLPSRYGSSDSDD